RLVITPARSTQPEASWMDRRGRFPGRTPAVSPVAVPSMLLSSRRQPRTPLLRSRIWTPTAASAIEKAVGDAVLDVDRAGATRRGDHGDDAGSDGVAHERLCRQPARGRGEHTSPEESVMGSDPHPSWPKAPPGHSVRPPIGVPRPKHRPTPAGRDPTPVR